MDRPGEMLGRPNGVNLKVLKRLGQATGFKDRITPVSIVVLCCYNPYKVSKICVFFKENASEIHIRLHFFNIIMG
ncbi:MAG: hypothetical protein HUK11_06780 [Muribaculaceae bacterium]|nr:hypothetical protein [Muribaculaceae bacterium]